MGEEGAEGGDFARVYADHVWHVYGFIAYRVGSREQAEDLTQATFERALKAWARFDPQRASEQAWLLTIARNAVIDAYRRDRLRTETLDENESHERLAAPGPEPDLGISPELELALRSLSQRDREVIALRFGGDMSAVEIAGLTGLSLANVQQILSRSLRRMRERLEAVGGPDASTD